MPGIVERGAIISDGELVNALHVPRVFDGDCSVVRQCFEKCEVAFAETFGTDAVDQLDYAETLIAEANRNGDDRARLHFRIRVHAAEESRILAGIRNDYNFTSLRDPTCESLPGLDANVFESFGTFAGGDLEVEFFALLIH